jgi:superoxide dismutase, Cu-Zn family
MLKGSFLPNHVVYSFFSQLLASTLMIAAITSCACTDSRKTEARKGNNQNKEIAAIGTLYSTKAPVTEAVAKIKPLNGSQVSGVVFFTKVPGGVQVIADVEGLSPGKHGFHVHEFGDCSGNGSKTGAHFNPTHQRHGGPNSVERHVGDLGNIDADENGYAYYERIDKIITLEGENSIIGRSIVIHADRDDFVTQPSGASGVKIACGVIEAVEVRE